MTPIPCSSFEDNNILLRSRSSREIDRFKRESTELGQNARSLSRMLDGFSRRRPAERGRGPAQRGQLRIIFQKGVAAKNGHVVFSTDSVDNRILLLAFTVQKSQPKSQTILVSKDINLRIKADALGLLAEDYETDRILIKDLYTGMIELTVSPEKMAAFRANGQLELNGGQQYFPNEYCTLADENQPQAHCLTKVDPTGTKLLPMPGLPRRHLGHQTPQRETAISPSTPFSMTGSSS